MLASMADALEPGDAENRKLCQRLACRVGRPVEGVASVRPATRRGWISWVGLGVDSSLAPILVASVAVTATLSGQERRQARSRGLATRMALAVTEHEAHLFRTRAMGRIIGDHVMAVPYGLVTKVEVGKRESEGIVASLVRVKIELTDGSKIKLDGAAGDRWVLELLQARAAAIPVGTVAPPPAQQPEPSVARVLALAAGHVAKGAVAGLVARNAGAAGEQVGAQRDDVR
jgi:hypothetical protein